jgi:AbrB family looped-hinge helix DNA binding protein
MMPDEAGTMKFTVYLREDGRITVPKEVRDALNLQEGDLVEFTVRKVKVKADRQLLQSPREEGIRRER